MKRMPTRAARLATAVSIAGVAALSAGPAFADSNINYFQGGGTGQAVNLQVTPSTILNGVDLSAVQSAINSVPQGVGATLTQNLGGTLSNLTSPVTVVVDSAQVGAKSADGTHLSDGTLTGAPGLGATSAPIDINAKALDTELATLKTALTNMPVGTDAALKQALAPLLAANPSLAQTVNALDPVLNNQTIADTLGAPTVSLESIDASLQNGVGQSNTHALVTVNGDKSATSLLNPGSTYNLDPFQATALPSGALANNKVTSLNLVGSGTVSVPSLANLENALVALNTALTSVENSLLSSAGQAPVLGPVATKVGGIVLPTIQTTTGQTLQSVTSKVTSVDLTSINGNLAAIQNLLNQLEGMSGLNLADIVDNQSDTARASLQRTSTGVSATGQSAVVDLSAVKLNAGPLATAFNQISTVASKANLSLAPTLLEVQGVSAQAAVTLDGVHPAQESASGNLASISVLGQKILGSAQDVASGKALASLDTYLPAGGQCVITVPAVQVMKCTNGAALNLGVALPVPTSLSSALNGLPLATITLTRGVFTQEANPAVTSGASHITTLEATVDLASGSTLLSVQKALGLNLLAAPASGTQAAKTTHAVDLQLGIASANAALTPNSANFGPTPPKTGSEIVPLGILALALLAGGIGIGVRQRYAVRRG